jgi:SAM-dependent methyltransferase
MKAIRDALVSMRPSDQSLVTWFDSYASNHANRLAHDVDLITAFVPRGSRILDVGCVPPALLAALDGLGYCGVGVDIAPRRFEECIAERALDVRQADIERDALPFDDASFDAIVLHEVFEHLRINLIATMSELARVLRPGGLLFLSTPNLRSYKGLYNFIVNGQAASCSPGVYPQYAKLRELGHMGHVREYTAREVTEFLGQVGFSVDTIVYRGAIRVRHLRLRLLEMCQPLRPFLSIVAHRST